MFLKIPFKLFVIFFSYNVYLLFLCNLQNNNSQKPLRFSRNIFPNDKQIYFGCLTNIFCLYIYFFKVIHKYNVYVLQHKQSPINNKKKSPFYYKFKEKLQQHTFVCSNSIQEKPSQETMKNV